MTKNFSKADRADFKAKKQGETKDLLAKLRAGVAAVSSSDDWKRCLKFQSSFHRYSFNNMMMILLQNPIATQVAGYRKWQSMGRQVKKGEKGLAILAPATRKFESEGKDGNTETNSYTFFRTVNVFDVSQTEGDELPQAKLCKLLDGAEDRATELFGTLSAYSTDVLGFRVEKVAVCLNRPSTSGVCYLEEKRIEVADRPALQQAKTLAHEIGHAIIHSGAGDYEEIHSRPDMEVEAESVAYCVLAAFGLDSSDYSFGYVAAWSGGDPKKVEASGKRIQKAVSQILCHMEAKADIAALRVENAELRKAA